MLIEKTWEDAQDPDAYDEELALRGLRKARFDPDAGKWEEKCGHVQLRDGTIVLVCRA